MVRAALALQEAKNNSGVGGAFNALKGIGDNMIASRQRELANAQALQGMQKEAYDIAQREALRQVGVQGGYLPDVPVGQVNAKELGVSRPVLLSLLNTYAENNPHALKAGTQRVNPTAFTANNHGNSATWGSDLEQEYKKSQIRANDALAKERTEKGNIGKEKEYTDKDRYNALVKFEDELKKDIENSYFDGTTQVKPGNEAELTEKIKKLKEIAKQREDMAVKLGIISNNNSNNNNGGSLLFDMGNSAIGNYLNNPQRPANTTRVENKGDSLGIRR
ncbi:MAG: hypothetical protein LBQ37_02110 [Elusimicrobiota bacterium]|jgi:hypothetical protein|nr:hypothetical protein [Elusimicrobiota bacterium]